MALERRVRLLGLGWLAAMLIWLPMEDVDAVWALLLGGTGCLWMATNVKMRAKRLGLTWLGALSGLATPLAAGLLMLFKTGLHAHGFSDFSGPQLWGVLRLTPYLGMAGLAAGAIWDLAAGGEIERMEDER